MAVSPILMPPAPRSPNSQRITRSECAATGQFQSIGAEINEPAFDESAAGADPLAHTAPGTPTAAWAKPPTPETGPGQTSVLAAPDSGKYHSVWAKRDAFQNQSFDSFPCFATALEPQHLLQRRRNDFRGVDSLTQPGAGNRLSTLPDPGTIRRGHSNGPRRLPDNTSLRSATGTPKRRLKLAMRFCHPRRQWEAAIPPNDS